MIRSYERKNVFFIQILGGDEEIPDIHFKKHYRLHIPVVPDSLDRYRHIVRVSGITNVAVFGADGVCTFNEEIMGDECAKAIDAALAAARGPNRKAEAFIDCATVYPPAVKAEGKFVHERMPSIAAGPDGEMHLAITTDEKGSNDVFLRTRSRGAWKKPVAVAATKADEYAPSVVAVGKGQALVAYVSNEKGLFDIHAALVKDGKVAKRWQVTRSSDDAMAPKLCVGEKGDPWLTWYEWAKMANLSRDREVLVSALRSGSWTKPVQVSPREVPTYEDHADPVVASDGKGGVWVAWAWDYHGTLQKKVPVGENSIFARHVGQNFDLGEILAVGFRGEGRARDYAPAIAVAKDGTPWVAWDNSHKASLGPSAKAVFVNHLAGADFGEQAEAAANNGTIDSPRLIVAPKGGLHGLWCQEARDGWEILVKPVGAASPGEARRLPIEGKRPRHAVAAFDSGGKLWFAYTDAVAPAWVVRVETLEGGASGS